MSAAPPGRAAVPRRRGSTGDVVSSGRLATALGCALLGRKGSREHLQVKLTARHEGRLEDTHGATPPGARRLRINGAGLAAALGCAPAPPPPHLNTHCMDATARRPAHKMPRRVARGTGRRRHHGPVHARRRGELGPRRWGARDSGRPHARSCRSKLTARRPAPRDTRRSARRDTGCRCTGLHHGEVVAKARRGAAGQDPRAHMRLTARINPSHRRP
jgi:hypothetical protein